MYQGFCTCLNHQILALVDQQIQSAVVLQCLPGKITFMVVVKYPYIEAVLSSQARAYISFGTFIIDTV